MGIVGLVCRVNTEMTARAFALGDNSGDSRSPATDRGTAEVVHHTPGDSMVVGAGETRPCYCRTG